jgi:hypothetical protein
MTAPSKTPPRGAGAVVQWPKAADMGIATSRQLSAVHRPWSRPPAAQPVKIFVQRY